ncbi:MAG: Spy/CpxP family protein refolding chaperone [Vicinamibacterales bacterium]
MTPFTKRIGLLAGAALLAAGLGSAYVSAQDNSGGHGPFMGRGRMGRFGGPGGPGGPGGLPLHRLNLTDAQRAQVKAVFDSHEAELKAIGERMRPARKALHDAIAANALDEATIRAKAADVAAVEADAAVLRGRIHSDVWQVLTPEQQKQAQALRAQMEQRQAERQNRRRQNRDGGRR